MRSADRQVNDVLMEVQSVMSESDKQAESVQEAYQLALMSMIPSDRVRCILQTMINIQRMFLLFA